MNNEIFVEWLVLGIIYKVPENQLSENANYLSHGACQSIWYQLGCGVTILLKERIRKLLKLLIQIQMI